MKNYPKTFDKISGFNKQETYKMKICSNQVLERTFSNHVFEIDVDSIEKLIYCSLQGGPFGGPACPPVLIIVVKYKIEGVYSLNGF